MTASLGMNKGFEMQKTERTSMNESDVDHSSSIFINIGFLKILKKP